MNCPRCGTEHAAKTPYCSACGAALGATITQGKTVVGTGTGTRIGMPVGPPRTVIAMAKTQIQGHATSLGSRPSGFTSVPRGPAPNQREHTAFTIDHSGSMSEKYDGSRTKLEAAQRASISLVVNKSQMDPYDWVGIACFSDHGQMVVPISELRTSKPQIIQGIQSLTIAGGTDLNDGLCATRDMFDWAINGIVRRIIFLTDGHGGNPQRTADELKARGVVIDVIGVGDDPSNVNEDILKAMASTIDGEVHYRFIKDQRTLVDHATQLAGKTLLGR